MSTILYPTPIFGPIHSRRLGISLGINLMPADGKMCTFDCIYCECGYNSDNKPKNRRPSREEIIVALENKLKEMKQQGQLPDVLTYAGNGEPTAHPQFKEIVIDTIALRNKYCPNAKVSVLTNATLIHRKEVFDALMMVDNNILKLDTVNAEYIKLVDQPCIKYSVEDQIKNMALFNGHCIIQTMFMKGTIGNIDVDNTSNKYVLPWLEALKVIKPQQVMIYTVDRETPEKTLRKASKEELDAIVDKVEKLGIKTSASY